MIKAFRLVRNIGCFDSCKGSTNTEFAPLTLVYAENGWGKTTLVAILRSLATGDPRSISARHRLRAPHAPHVVLEVEGLAQAVVFKDDQWSSSYDSITIFDDQFVDDNVYSGLSVGPDHRQNLHEIILGRQGVALARRVDELTDSIAQLNQQIRETQAAIPNDIRRGLDIDTFCGLELPDDIDSQVEALQKRVEATKQADRVSLTRSFSHIDFPSIDLPEVEALLSRELPDLDAEAVARVRRHVRLLGEDAERWISEGVSRIIQPAFPATDELCPFCGQAVTLVDLVDKYRAYFGDAYRSLHGGISRAIARYNTTLGGDALAECQRAISRLSEQRRFWNGLTTLPALEVDQEALASAWSAARDALMGVLSAKRAAPLEPLNLPDDVRQSVAEFQKQAGRVREQVDALVALNPAITGLKESAGSGDLALVGDELRRLKAAKVRHSDEIKPLCEAYLAVKKGKQEAEQDKKEAREALDTHRRQVFPSYGTRVNHYLHRFGASFRIEGVRPHDAAGRPSTAYYLKVRDTEVPLLPKGAAAQPCFRNSLSSGDRNTLALSFFLASLDFDTSLSNKVVVLDDPVSSLDDGRAITTVSEIRKVAERAKQLIVLSHAKPFLCRIFKHAKPDGVACLSLHRCAHDASTLSVWQPTEDELTAYDRRHKLLRDFQDGSTPNIWDVAQTLRPVMEGYLRVAFPDYCPPGTLLGQLRQRVQTQIDAGNPVMETARLLEMDEITEYANRFHHDTNPAWESESINETELVQFVRRVLDFVRH